MVTTNQAFEHSGLDAGLFCGTLKRWLGIFARQKARGELHQLSAQIPSRVAPVGFSKLDLVGGTMELGDKVWDGEEDLEGNAQRED